MAAFKHCIRCRYKWISVSGRHVQIQRVLMHKWLKMLWITSLSTDSACNKKLIFTVCSVTTQPLQTEINTKVLENMWIWIYLGRRIFHTGLPVSNKLLGSKTKLMDLLGPRSVVYILRAWCELPLTHWDIAAPTKLHVSNTTKAVNDAAKWNVQLYTYYLAILADDLVERARILQGVEKNWRDYPEVIQKASDALWASCRHWHCFDLSGLFRAIWWLVANCTEETW